MNKIIFSFWFPIVVYQFGFTRRALQSLNETYFSFSFEGARGFFADDRDCINRFAEFDSGRKLPIPTMQVSDFIIIDGYEKINTSKKLISRFKGKMVYVDLWASWCEPCLEDFAYSSDLYQSLSKQNIEILYISIDTAQSEWRKVLKSHKLPGYHVRANDSLKDDLSTMIWGAKGGYSIPHFLIFDKNGTLVSKDAHSPEKKNDLLIELEKYQ